MAPSVVTNRKYKMHNNINAKKLNRALVANAQLRKRIAVFSNQNKDLSVNLNNLLLHKLTMENENTSIKNENLQLNAMINAFRKRLHTLEQTLQKCLPALVTLSECVPSMMTNVREMSKFDKIFEFNKTEKKEKQTRCVRPMINGMTIKQPAITIKRFDMSTIIESPNSEQSPRPTRKFSNRNQLLCNIDLQPYVRLKDVAVLLKNSKAVRNEESPRHRLDENLGEGPSWLHGSQNSDNNSSVTENHENSSQVSNETSTPVRETALAFGEVTSDMSLSNLNVNDNISHNLFNDTEISKVSLTSPGDSSMLRNITCRRPQKSRSRERSVGSELDTSSTSVIRSRRSAKKNINYQEPKLITKLRRN